MTSWGRRRRTRDRPSLIPVIASLVAVVVVPATAVVWLVDHAADNEILASRQRLIEAYRAHLETLRAELQTAWLVRAAALDPEADEAAPPRLFARRVREGWVDSLVVYGDRGEVAYPSTAIPDGPLADGEGWVRARRLEHREGRPDAAARIYADLAQRAESDDEAAQALLAQARCLARAGEREAAVSILAETLAAERFRNAVDRHGRSIVADAELRALELLQELGRGRPPGIADRLAARLSDYGAPVPATQRRFLMRALAALEPRAATFDTLGAERLAADLLSSGLVATAPTILRRSSLDGVYQVVSADRRVLALFRQDRLSERLRSALRPRRLPNVVLSVLSPDAGEEGALLSVPAGAALPGWRLALSPRDPRVFATAAGRRAAVYLWSGAAAVASTAIVGLWLARSVRRQLRLAALQNDLLATVSHELKAPLSSMRVLVDTLLDADRLAEPRTREYLELIASENARLSRLVHSFLTYSRWSRGRQPLELAAEAPEQLARRAVAAVAPQLERSGRRLELEIDPDLPSLLADGEAIVTALTNLFDNADKFSEGAEPIALRVFAEAGRVGFAVADRGVGLTRWEAARVFRRFYQVDRRLSRRGGGCGLGLSIVREIVRRHGGTVAVDSEPEAGSVFTIRLPAQRRGADGPGGRQG